MNPSLAIVAVGARTPVGLAAEPTAAAVRAGLSGIREYPFLATNGEPLNLGVDARLDARLEGRERVVQLAQSVLLEVLRKLNRPGLDRSRVRVLLALPGARPGFSDADAAAVIDTLSSHLRSEGLTRPVELAGRGHAGVIAAIERFAHPADDAPLLVVGADSHAHPDTLVWLERERMLASEGARDGFVPGEAAGCLALASPRVCQTLGLPRLAAVAAVGTAYEDCSRTSETGSLGVGMTRAVTTALVGLAGADHVDVVHLDINGERYRSEEWGFVTLRVGGALGAGDYVSPCECWGDVGAASGALLAGLAVQSWARGYARGPRALVATGSLDGLRSAMLLRAPA
jgi:3-oxoacyl-[acyl-carrier-protein] synthase-1